MRTSRPSTRTRAPVGPSRTRSFFQVFASFSAAISARQKSVRLVLMPARLSEKQKRRPERARRRKERGPALYFFVISVATNWVEERLPATAEAITKVPFTWTAEPTTIPVSTFVSPFMMTSREEIFQWPSGAPFAVGAAGIDSTMPSNSVAPGGGGVMAVALVIEIATRYEGAREPGGGLWTSATTSTISPTWGSPTIFVSESTCTTRPAMGHAVDVLVCTAPRNAKSSGGVTNPMASTLVARRPPEFTTTATMAYIPVTRSPMPLTGPLGPAPDQVVAEFVEMAR